MKESIVTFGPDKSLVGILTEPGSKPSGRPAVIIPNAGVLHRVGPFRLHVDLARALSKEGLTVLRFDLSGLGDSAQRRTNEEETARFRADVEFAMEYLERRKNLRSFVVGGLCSGADLAHEIALENRSVVGAFFLDGYGYATPRYKMRALSRRLTNGRLWKQWIAARLAALRGEPPLAPAEDLENYIRNFPAAERFKSEVLALCGRNVKLLYVYTSGSSHYYNYQAQFRDMLGIAKLPPEIRVELYPLADHTFSIASDRKRLIEGMRSWARNDLAGAPRVAERAEAMEPAYILPAHAAVTAAEKS